MVGNPEKGILEKSVYHELIKADSYVRSPVPLKRKLPDQVRSFDELFAQRQGFQDYSLKFLRHPLVQEAYDQQKAQEAILSRRFGISPFELVLCQFLSERPAVFAIMRILMNSLKTLCITYYGTPLLPHMKLR